MKENGNYILNPVNDHVFFFRVLEGELNLNYVDHQHFFLHAADCFLCSGNDLCDILVCKMCNFIIIEFISDYDFSLYVNRIWCVELSSKEFIELNEAISHLYSPAWQYNAYANAIVSMQLQKYILHSTPVQAVNCDINLVLAHIWGNLNENLSVSDLAKKLNISERYFRYSFIKSTGLSPKKYMQEIKLNIASELLRDTKYSISEIASFLGCSDYAQFSKMFKKRYNKSPALYRKNIII